MNQYSENVRGLRRRASTSVRPKTRKGNATRQRLLAAAEFLFGKKGYFETSVVDITQRAKVALGTFYVYFPGKLAIFRELVEFLNHNLRQELQMATENLANRAEVERVGFLTFFSFISRHRDLYRIVQQADLVDQDLYQWYYRKISQRYAERLSEAAEKGQIRRLDPECLAYCLMGIAHFLGMRWVLWEGKDVPEGDSRTAMEFIYRGILEGQGRSNPAQRRK